MEVGLIKDKSSWIVINHDGQLESFDVIEQACDFLERSGVLDDEIDIALMEMSFNNHDYAHFDTKGKFQTTKQFKGRV